MVPEKFTLTWSDGRIVQVEISKDVHGTYRWARKDAAGTTTHAGLPSMIDALHDAEMAITERRRDCVVRVTSDVAWEQTSDGLYRATIYGQSVTVMLQGEKCDIVVEPDDKGQFTGHCRGYDWKKVAEGMARTCAEMESYATTQTSDDASVTAPTAPERSP